ncbi:MAG: hypothetical protein ACJ72M_15910 [Propionibacteriaceae bacterium]
MIATVGIAGAITKTLGQETIHELELSVWRPAATDPRSRAGHRIRSWAATVRVSTTARSWIP